MISRLFCFQFIHDPVVSISFVLSRFVSYETYLKRLSYCGNLILDGLSDMFDFVCDLEAVEMWASGREIPEHCWESGSSGMLKGQSMEAGNGRSWSDHRNEKCVYVTICVHVHMNIYTYIFIYLVILASEIIIWYPATLEKKLYCFTIHFSILFPFVLWL